MRIAHPLPIGRFEHSPVALVVVVLLNAVNPFGVRPQAMYSRAAVGRMAHTTLGPRYGLLVDSLGIVAHGTRQSMSEPSVALTLASAFRGTPFM